MRDPSPSAAAGAQLGVHRRAAGWLLALAGPAGLAALLAPATDATTLAAESMAFLAVTVLCALIGGLWPAVAGALLSTLLLTWYFTPPRRTFVIDRPADLVLLALFLGVGMAVSWVVHQAARRTAQAAEARREADALTDLNRTVLRSEQDLDSLVALVRATFAAEAASLLRAGDVGDHGGGVIAAVGDPPLLQVEQADEVAEVAPSSPPLVLALRGGHLSASDRRVLASFAGHLAVVLERRRLAAGAARTRRLEEGARVRNALLAAVSHDLRTPLARLKAAVSSLRSTDVDWDEDDERELLAAIEASTDQLHAIVSNLLDLSRIQSDAVTPALQEVGLEDVVARSLDHAVLGGSVAVEVEPGLPPVRADAGLLERVVANLVDNAVRHSPAGTPVQLVLTAACGRVAVRVVDHGAGVPPAEQEQMFAAFRRLGDAEARDGLGLGLAVARGLTEAMGGTLRAADTPGGGLTMVVDLPAAPARPAAVAGGGR